jgi:hypothetical protein
VIETIEKTSGKKSVIELLKGADPGCFSGWIERRALVRGDLGCDPRFPGIAGRFEIVAGLQVDPIVGGGIKVASEAQRGFPGDGALPGDYGAARSALHQPLAQPAAWGSSSRDLSVRTPCRAWRPLKREIQDKRALACWMEAASGTDQTSSDSAIAEPQDVPGRP